MSVSLIDEATDWLSDCFAYDMPADLSDEETLEAVERHYDGGLAGFIRDSAL